MSIVKEIQGQMAQIRLSNRRPTAIYMGHETFMRFCAETENMLTVASAMKLMRANYMGCDIFEVDENEHLKVTA